MGYWSQRRVGLHGQKSPPLVPDWPILIQMNPQSLIGPKVTVLIGQIRTTITGQNCTALVE